MSDETTPELPPCGCKSGCEHRDHPQFTPQRACRLGYVRPTSPERGKTRPCALDDPHAGHVRQTGAWCPGLDEDEDGDEPEDGPAVDPSAADDMDRLGAALAEAVPALAEAGRVFVQGLAPIVAEIHDMLTRWEAADRERAKSAGNGPARDPFRRQGRE